MGVWRNSSEKEHKQLPQDSGTAVKKDQLPNKGDGQLSATGTQFKNVYSVAVKFIDLAGLIVRNRHGSCSFQKTLAKTEKSNVC